MSRFFLLQNEKRFVLALRSGPLQTGEINPNLTFVDDRKKSNRESTRVRAEIVSVLSRVPLFIVK